MKTYILSAFSVCLIAFVPNVIGQVDLYNGLVGCYPFSGNASDMSGNKHHGIVNGASLTTDRFGNLNSAYHFNGLSDFIAINNFDSLSSTNELTISCWAAADLQTSNSVFMLSPDSMQDRLVGSVEYNGNIYFDYGNILTNGRSTTSQTYSTSWNHYVFVISQSKDLKRVYVNKVPVINTTYGGSLVKRKKKLYIGAGTDVNNGNIRFHGSIDDIRIYNRSVNAAEIDSMYASVVITCVAPSINCLVACLPFKGNASDMSGNKHHGIVNGASLTTDRFGNLNSAYHFNGLSDFIAINNFDSLSSTNELTISCWAAADLQTSNSVFMLSPDSMQDRLVGSVEYNGNIYFDYGNILTNGRSTTSQTYSTNWNHYVFVISQSKNLKQVFVNNVAVINTSYGGSLVKRKKKLYIGAGTDVNNGNIRFHGSISDFRVYNCALAASEIAQVYTGSSCASVGISPIMVQNDLIKVYPNPSTGQLTIDLGNFINEKSTIYILNTLGQVIYSEIVPMDNKLVQINLDGLIHNGIYTLMVQNNSGRATKKIIFSQ